MISFTKACGLGNDFVMIRSNDSKKIQSMAPFLADRRYGVGCDQVIVVSDDLFVRFFNPDGSEAEACGNGSRCAALWLMEPGQETIRIKTLGGELLCEKDPSGKICISMPTPRLLGNISLNLEGVLEAPPVALEVGNPHLVCFAHDPHDIETFGPQLESHPAFPHRTNVGFAKVKTPQHLELRVYERGTGLTLACGSGACAAFYAAYQKGLVENQAVVSQQGGDLLVSLKDGILYQTGEAKIIFSGTLSN